MPYGQCADLELPEIPGVKINIGWQGEKAERRQIQIVLRGEDTKKLEELGIGRPATYATTISTIQNRGYVAKGENEGQERSYKSIELKNPQLRRFTYKNVKQLKYQFQQPQKSK